jgi:molybdate-binding protein
MKLTKEQIIHLYELAFSHFQDECYDCQKLKARMEKHLGERVVKEIKKIIKKYPYE